MTAKADFGRVLVYRLLDRDDNEVATIELGDHRDAYSWAEDKIQDLPSGPFSLEYRRPDEETWQTLHKFLGTHSAE